MPEIAINQPMVDWWRVTSWESMLPDGAQLLDSKPQRRMNYLGELYDGSIYHGKGYQAGRPHYLCECSGAAADGSHRWPVNWQRCTRLDLQLTLESHRHTIGNAARQMRILGQKSLKTRLISNDDQTDTLYIGSRQSEIYWRLYLKTGPGTPAGGAVDCCRLEAELKGDLAHQAYTSLRSGKASTAAILGSLVDRLPAVDALAPWLQWDYGIDNQPAAVVKVAGKVNMNWIRNTVYPVIWRALCDHDSCTEVANELQTMLDAYEIDIVDKAD